MANITTKEKIDVIIKWVRDYPELTLYKMRNTNFIKDKYGNNLSKYALSKLEKKYMLLREYYIYLSLRKSGGKLREDELLTLKESNVGGVFGYSSKVEELAEKNNIPKKLAFRIIRKYSTIENFYSKYKDNSITDIEDQMIGERVFKPVYNIDGDSRYDDLVMELIRNKNTLNLYSSKKLEEVLLKYFDERQIKIIKNRFGIVEPKKTLEELAKEDNVCITRIRTIESNIIKKLNSHLLNNLIICEEDKVMELLNDEDKEILQNAIRKAYVSKDNENEILVANLCIKSIILNNNDFITSIKGSKRDIEKDTSIKIDSLDLDPYLIRTLKRREIITLGDLFKPENIMMLRKLEKETLSKIKEKVSELGYTLRVEKDEFTITGDIEKDSDYPLACLDINVKTYNALGRRKIYTLGELLKYDGDVLKIHNMGEKGYKELLEQLHMYGYYLKQEQKEDKDDKESLVDEYFLLLKEQELLKAKLEQKEKEIKIRQAFLKSKGLI